MPIGFTNENNQIKVTGPHPFFPSTNEIYSTPTVTALSDGGYLVGWSTYQNHPYVAEFPYIDDWNWDVRARIFDENGGTSGGDYGPSPVTTGDQKSIDATTLADGSYVLTWNFEGVIYGKLVAADGQTLRSNFVVNTHAGDGHANASVTALNSGGFLVVWESMGQDGSGDGIYAQRFDESGNSVRKEFQVNTHTSDSQRFAESIALKGGGFVITWQSIGQDGDREGIFAQMYDARGRGLGDEFQVNTLTTSAQYSADITALKDGGFVIVWTSNAIEDGIFAQRYDAGGNPLGEEFQVNTSSFQTYGSPKIATMADGGFVVVWTSNVKVITLPDGTVDLTGGFNLYDFDVLAQRYDANGERIGGEVTVNATADGNQFSPDITTLADGGFVITWDTNGPDDVTSGIYAQQFAAQLFGTSSADTIIDNIEANWLNGQAGSDILHGRSGADSIFGGKGNDVLRGGAQDDTLYGQAGADVLNGGAGRDILTGGRGADTFVFNKASHSAAGTNADVITDFEVGVDRIDLSAFLGDTVVLTSAVGTDTVVQIDMDSDGAADMKIVLTGVTGLSASDFIL